MIGNLAQVCVCSWYSKMDIPASDSLSCPLRKGFLHKLTGRGWLYSGTWKHRYCVLQANKLYFYEKEHSKGSEKSCGVLNLDYFDVCEESVNARDKKNPHVFVVGTSVKGFFDNRHQFSAENAEDLQSWIRAIRSAITDARDNRRKPAGRKQRHLEGKSPDLSHSSQESEETPTCLPNATKDRVRGPQGRRLPQRKSMMPSSRKEVLEEDIRQRSISVSSPQRSDTTPPQSPSGDGGGKWLSLSMEAVDKEKEDEGLERSSSVFDLPHKGSKEEQGGKGVPKRGGGLMGQHAALTKELEMRLRAGMAPGGRRPPPEESVEKESDEVATKDENGDARLERLTSKVEAARETIASLEARMDQLTRKVETASEKNAAQVGDVLLQVTVTLKEAERINDECKRALADANLAKTEYQLLVKQCRETLDKLNSDPESQQHGA